LDKDTLLSIESLSFGYTRDRLILNDISMTFKRGSVVALMGGSGSGKTTVLRLIGAQERPQKGRVLLNGVDVHSLSKRELYRMRRNMGMLFQFGALFTDLSIFDNVAFPLREQTDLPESMIRDLVLMKLHAVGLRGAAHLMPSEISGGMARRVALARTIALDPELMLFDEPFTGLDPISLGVIAHLIHRVTKALRSTSIMVTHDVGHSLNLVDQIIFLAHGEIVFSGSPAEMERSESDWVRQFVHGESNGPVAFRYPASTSLRQDLLGAKR